MKVPLFWRIFTPYDPSFYGIFWDHVFANMGGWGGQNCFHTCQFSGITVRGQKGYMHDRYFLKSISVTCKPEAPAILFLRSDPKIRSLEPQGNIYMLATCQKSFVFLGSYMCVIPQHVSRHMSMKKINAWNSWEFANVKYTFWRHVEDVSELIVYRFRPQRYSPSDISYWPIIILNSFCGNIPIPLLNCNYFEYIWESRR